MVDKSGLSVNSHVEQNNHAKGIRMTKPLILFFIIMLGATACATAPDQKAASPDSLTMEAGRRAYLAQDYSRAASLLRQEAELGNPHAQYTLGYMYYHGQGVTEDTEQALKWIRQAAAQGDARALEALSSLAEAGMRPDDQAKKSKD